MFVVRSGRAPRAQGFSRASCSSNVRRRASTPIPASSMLAIHRPPVNVTCGLWIASMLLAGIGVLALRRTFEEQDAREKP